MIILHIIHRQFRVIPDKGNKLDELSIAQLSSWSTFRPQKSRETQLEHGRLSEVWRQRSKLGKVEVQTVGQNL
jgi:hypothetical protein